MGVTFSSLKDSNDYKLMDKASENFILQNIEINKQIESLKIQSEVQKRNIYNLNEKLKNLENSSNTLIKKLRLENKYIKLNQNKDIKQKQNEIIESITQLVQSINIINDNNDEIKNLSSDIYQYKVFVNNMDKKNKLLHQKVKNIKNISNKLETKFSEIITLQKNVKELQNALSIYKNNSLMNEKISDEKINSITKNISFFPDTIEKQLYHNVHKIVLYNLEKIYHNTEEL